MSITPSNSNFNTQRTFSLPIEKRPMSCNNSFTRNNNNVFQPLTPNKFSNNTKQINIQNYNKTTTNFNKREKDYHPLDFYTKGKVKNMKAYSTTCNWNNGFKSTSNNLLQRNELSINSSDYNFTNFYKNVSTINDQNISENNYMNPLKTYKTFSKYNIPNYGTNPETFNLMKEKLFCKEMKNTITKGKNITKKEFLLEKENLMKSKNKNNENNKTSSKRQKILPKKEVSQNTNSTGIQYIDPNDYSKKELKPNYLYFDKNNNQMLKNRKWSVKFFDNKKNKTCHKVSKDAPEWFNIIPEWKVEQFNNYLANNEDTINIISKHQSWITVSPRTKDRKRPLEKMKAENMEVTSKIMPKWMEIIHKNEKNEENLKSVEYEPIKQKCKKLMLFVDKELNFPKDKLTEYNPNKSVFSFLDFRHNVVTKKEYEIYNKKVSQEPKRLLEWDDGTVFDPKYKRDVKKK